MFNNYAIISFARFGLHASPHIVQHETCANCSLYMHGTCTHYHTYMLTGKHTHIYVHVYVCIYIHAYIHGYVLYTAVPFVLITLVWYIAIHQKCYKLKFAVYSFSFPLHWYVHVLFQHNVICSVAK